MTFHHISTVVWSWYAVGAMLLQNKASATEEQKFMDFKPAICYIHVTPLTTSINLCPLKTWTNRSHSVLNRFYSVQTWNFLLLSWTEMQCMKHLQHHLLTMAIANRTRKLCYRKDDRAMRDI